MSPEHWRKELPKVSKVLWGKGNMRNLPNSFCETITLATKFYKDITRKQYKPICDFNVEVTIISELLQMNIVP